MKNVLRFHSKPELSDLEGLNIDGNSFKLGESFIVDNEIIMMKIPKAFRFHTNLEILETQDNHHEMVMTQILTRWAESWEMRDAFGRVGFNNPHPETEEQMRLLCDKLVEKDLAYWVND